VIDLYSILKSSHILLLSTWLGIDLGVATCAALMRRADLSPEARGAFGRLWRLLDVGPQVSMLLTVPVALSLTALGNWGLSDPTVVGAAFGGPLSVLATVWAAVVAWSLFRPGPLNRALFPVDIGVRVGIAVVFVVIAANGVPGNWWIGAKSLIFAAIVVAMAILRWTTRDTAATIGAIASGDSSREPALGSQLAPVMVISALVWTGIAANIVLAVLKVR
jgi:hypothetical protein